MKRVLSILPLLVTITFPAMAQTADEVVKNYIDAIGGPEKVASIKTVKMTGSLSVQGIDVGVIVTASHGIGHRTDISVPGMGDGFQIYSPTKGWSYMPFQGQTSVEEMPDEQLKNGLGQLDLQGQLYNYKEKGNKIELLGKEKVEGVECYKLKVETAAGKVATLYIDTKTYYRVKSVAAGTTGQEVEILYSNYKKTEDGYVYPFSMTNPNGTIEFSSIEVNKPVDPAIFKN